MELNDKYRIIFDENNVILQFFENRVDKNGKEKEFVDNFYYPNIKTALNGFLVKETWGTKTVTEFLDKINEVENIISNLK